MIEIHIRISRRLVFAVAVILVLGIVVPFVLAGVGGR